MKPDNFDDLVERIKALEDEFEEPEVEASPKMVINKDDFEEFSRTYTGILAVLEVLDDMVVDICSGEHVNTFVLDGLLKTIHTSVEQMDYRMDRIKRAAGVKRE